MSQIFASYEQDCRTAIEAVSRRISELTNFTSVPGNPDKIRILEEARRALSKASQHAANMEQSLSDLDSAKRYRAKESIKSFKARITQLDQQLTTIGNSNAGERSALFGNSSIPSTNGSFDESAARANEHLQNTLHSLRSSEDIGGNVIDSLHEQRRTLLNAHEQVQETNSMVEKSRMVLKRMAYRAMYNRAFLYGVIALEILCIFLVLYYMYIKPATGGSTPAPQPTLPPSS